MDEIVVQARGAGCQHPTPPPASPDRDSTSDPRDHDGRPVLFATLRAENINAVLLLALVKEHCPPGGYLSRHLVVEQDDQIEYRLFLDPDAPSLSWTIGVDGPADLLLCPPPGTPGYQLVHQLTDAIHACFHVHPHSGHLVLQNRSDRTSELVLGPDKIDVLPPPVPPPSSLSNRGAADHTHHRPDIRAFAARPTATVRIGPFELSLSYAPPPPGSDGLRRFVRARDAVMAQFGVYPTRLLDPFPLPTHRLDPHGQVRLHRLLTRSGLMQIYSGVQTQTGTPVAVKSWVFRESTTAAASASAWMLCRNEVFCMRYLGGAASTGVIGFTHLWQKAAPLGRAFEFRPSRENVPLEEVSYAMALPEYNFDTMSWADVSPHTRLRYFYETLVGLGVIHGRSMVHRSIRPEVLALVPIGQSDQCFFDQDPPYSLPAPSTTSSSSSSSSSVLPSSLPPSRPPRPPGEADSSAELNRFEAAISDLCYAHPVSYLYGPESVANIWVAPEVRSCSATRPYSYESDMWSLALSWLHTFQRLKTTRYTTGQLRKRHTRVRGMVGQLKDRFATSGEEQVLHPLFDLLGQMLEWHPGQRPSVAQALAHRAWDPIRRAVGGFQEDHVGDDGGDGMGSQAGTEGEGEGEAREELESREQAEHDQEEKDDNDGGEDEDEDDEEWEGFPPSPAPAPASDRSSTRSTAEEEEGPTTGPPPTPKRTAWPRLDDVDDDDDDVKPAADKEQVERAPKRVRFK